MATPLCKLCDEPFTLNAYGRFRHQCLLKRFCERRLSVNGVPCLFLLPSVLALVPVAVPAPDKNDLSSTPPGSDPENDPTSPLLGPASENERLVSSAADTIYFVRLGFDHLSDPAAEQFDFLAHRACPPAVSSFGFFSCAEVCGSVEVTSSSMLDSPGRFRFYYHATSPSELETMMRALRLTARNVAMRWGHAQFARVSLRQEWAEGEAVERGVEVGLGPVRVVGDFALRHKTNAAFGVVQRASIEAEKAVWIRHLQRAGIFSGRLISVACHSLRPCVLHAQGFAYNLVRNMGMS